jgi:hypothetical protein
MMLYDRAIGIATGQELDGRGVRIKSPGRAGEFFLLHSVQTGSRAPSLKSNRPVCETDLSPPLVPRLIIRGAVPLPLHTP